MTKREGKRMESLYEDAEFERSGKAGEDGSLLSMALGWLALVLACSFFLLCCG